MFLKLDFGSMMNSKHLIHLGRGITKAMETSIQLEVDLDSARRAFNLPENA